MLTGNVILLLGTPLLVGIAAFRLKSGVRARRVLTELLFGVYLLMLVNVVLFPLRVDPGLRADDAVWDHAAFLRNSVNLAPFASIQHLMERPSRTQAFRQIAGNLLLLMPLGVMLPVLVSTMRRPPLAVPVILATAIGIEVAQFMAHVARISIRSVDVDDVILNVTGGIVGFLVWWLWSRLGSRPTSAST